MLNIVRPHCKASLRAYQSLRAKYASRRWEVCRLELHWLPRKQKAASLHIMKFICMWPDLMKAWILLPLQKWCLMTTTRNDLSCITIFKSPEHQRSTVFCSNKSWRLTELSERNLSRSTKKQNAFPGYLALGLLQMCMRTTRPQQASFTVQYWPRGYKIYLWTVLLWNGL